jgi:hypothetical protein
VSILDELGGDIGPRDSTDDITESGKCENVEGGCGSPIELDDFTKPVPDVNKGKHRDLQVDVGDDPLVQ